jgi:hypothetical protein
MMGRQTGDQSQLCYLFNLEKRIPARHLLRRINPIVTRVLADLREKLKPFYSEAGRPSIDPELMLRMLVVGYCYGIRFERKLCEAITPDSKTASGDPAALTPYIQALGVSDWRRCVCRRAKARRYRDYSGNHKNRKYAAVSGDFVADEPVLGEPVSGQIPCYQGKKQGISQNR